MMNKEIKEYLEKREKFTNLERFELRIGKFGPYFIDRKETKELSLMDVLNTLNYPSEDKSTSSGMSMIAMIDCVDIIRHYNYVQGFISDKTAFNMILYMLRKRQNPFEEEQYLKKFVKNVFKKDPTYVISHLLIDPGKVSEIENNLKMEKK